MEKREEFLSKRLSKYKKFIFVYKEERYESQNSPYTGDLMLDIRRSFIQGADIVNESLKKKREKQRRRSEGGIVSSIRRKLSTDRVVTKDYSDVVDIITEKDIELFNLNVEQNEERVTITVVNYIDPRWFRKSVKIFFQWQLIKNGII